MISFDEVTEEHSLEPRQYQWRFIEMIGIAGAILACTAFGGAILMIAMGIDLTDPNVPADDMLIINLGFLAINFAAFIGPIMAVAHIRDVGVSELGWRLMSFRHWQTSLFIGLLAIPLSNAAAFVVIWVMGQTFDNPQTEFVMPAGFSWTGLVGMVLLVGILIPLAEEFFFRGILYVWLKQRMSVSLAMLVSSLIFGVVHVLPALIAGTFVLGLCCAWVYERSNSLWSAWLVHAINNAIKVAVLYATLAG